MLVQNKIHGDAGPGLIAHALKWISTLVTVDASVRAMMERADILLLVQVQDGEGDQDTVIAWKDSNKRTMITITIFTDLTSPQNEPRLREDLLHELVLHAKRATDKHIAAVGIGQAPVYPTSNDDIEKEEEAEHLNAEAWYEMADIAVQLKDSDVLDRVFTDAAEHDQPAALAALARVFKEGKIDSNYEEEMRETIVAAQSDGEDSGSDSV